MRPNYFLFLSFVYLSVHKLNFAYANTTNKKLVLSFSQLLFYNFFVLSGLYGCAARPTDPSETSVGRRGTTIQVISQPTVSLSPSSTTVDEGEGVDVTCTLLTPLDITASFRWYKDGQPFQPSAGNITF